MSYRDKAAMYTLTAQTVERWQELAPAEGRKLIRALANKRRELMVVAQELKDRKAWVRMEMQKEKEQGAKVTEKAIDAVVDLDDEVKRLRQERDSLAIDIQELDELRLHFRDLFRSAESLRNSETMLMRMER